ncbi:hypothetical protein ACFL4O_00635 [bacterium]
MKNKMKLLLSFIYVFTAGFACGFVIHFLVMQNNPDLAYLQTAKIKFLISFASALLLFVFWWIYIIFTFLFFRKKVSMQNIISFALKDSQSYFPFYIFFLYKYLLSILPLLPFILIACSIALKLKLFNKNLKFIYYHIDKNLYSVINFFSNINQYLKKLNTSILSFIEHKNYNKLINKIYKTFKFILIIYIILIGFSKLHNMYNIPVERPYFTGGVDEPFSINAGINILRTKGNPMFYNYGGTSTMPYAVSFFIYSLKTAKKPYYKYFGEKFFYPSFPNRWDTYPVKPIYYARVFAVIFFIILSILLVALFSWHLLPIPFFLFQMIDHSHHLSFYQDKLMGNAHIAFASAITCILFIIAVQNIKNSKKYLKYMYLCFLCASISAAVKLTGLAAFIFPASLLVYLYIKNDFNLLFNKKILLKAAAFSIIPYILLTPAVILDLGRYVSWLQKMLIKQSISPLEWLEPDRINNALIFIKDLFFLKSIPGIVLLILLISSAVIFIKIHPVFFTAIAFFHLFVFQTIITNTGDFPFSRLYMVLLFTPVIFLFFPLIYVYKKIPNYFKVFILGICTIITLSVYNAGLVYSGLKKLIKNDFTASWEKESRDEFVDYVNNNNLKVYFFDFHSFSVPENLHDKLTFFNSTSELPPILEENSIICFIKYNKPKIKSNKMHKRYNKYLEITSKLLNKYKVIRIIGNNIVTYDWINTSKNPTIVCLSDE